MNTKPLLAALTFAALVGMDSGQAQTLGDLDDNGGAIVRDIALISVHLNGTATLDESQRQFAGVNGDGATNAADMDEPVREIPGTREPESLPLFTIRSTSPSNGEGNVAVTRETVINFTVPLTLETTFDIEKFSAEFAERRSSPEWKCL